ncbi:MAG: hypothetical protein HQK49_12635 [Oligoflexia bacterium]|nr:hypothetical protein [Oligoflexia bacterium]
MLKNFQPLLSLSLSLSLKILTIIVSIIASTHPSSSWAINPTVESLFRNASNKVISENSTVIKFMINVISSEESATSASAPAMATDSTKLFVELTFFTDKNSGSLKILQKTFSDDKMNRNSFLNVVFIDSIEKLFTEFSSDSTTSSTSNISSGTSKNAFYSSLYQVFSNHHGLILKFLKDHNDNFQFNREIINKEKFELLEKYRLYLETIIQNPALKKTEVSPLQPVSSSDKAKAMALLKENSFYLNKNVSLTNENGEFFWKIQLKNSQALFSNDQHFLRLLSHTATATNSETFEINFEEYSIYNNLYMAPKYITIKSTEKKNYIMKIISLEHKDLSVDTLIKKASDLRAVAITVLDTKKIDFQQLKNIFPFLLFN